MHCDFDENTSRGPFCHELSIRSEAIANATAAAKRIVRLNFLIRLS